MAKKSRGLRANTRRKFSRGVYEKFTITPYLQEFKPHDRVVINVEPASHKGMPHHRFVGMVGEIKERRGNAYVVNLQFENITKQIITRPEHLRLHK